LILGKIVRVTVFFDEERGTGNVFNVTVVDHEPAGMMTCPVAPLSV
jgi:hypothetical protein